MHHTQMTPSKHRFVTRADLDGLACAVMLEELELIDEMRFVHAQDVLDGSVEITERDITANLPYSAAAHRAFEYGPHALTRNTAHLRNHVIDPHATSAARLMWLHYGGAFSMPNVSESLLRAVDQASSADYRVEDVLHPQGWTLLNFILDATLGMINIDQNNILKIFSVVTVFLLPPSVIAGIFGMNFAHMPGLQQPWGFGVAVAAMVVSAVGPYVWFRQRGWL